MGKLSKDQVEAREQSVDAPEPVREVSVQQQYLDAHGREIPDPTPMAPPVGYVRRPSIAEQMRQMIQQASYEASQAGAETEEEANDFDVDDGEPWSPYEDEFEIDPAMEMMLARQSVSPPAPSAAGAAPQAPTPNPPPAAAPSPGPSGT